MAIPDRCFSPGREAGPGATAAPGRTCAVDTLAALEWPALAQPLPPVDQVEGQQSLTFEAELLEMSRVRHERAVLRYERARMDNVEPHVALASARDPGNLFDEPRPPRVTRHLDPTVLAMLERRYDPGHSGRADRPRIQAFANRAERDVLEFLCVAGGDVHFLEILEDCLPGFSDEEANGVLLTLCRAGAIVAGDNGWRLTESGRKAVCS